MLKRRERKPCDNALQPRRLMSEYFANQPRNRFSRAPKQSILSAALCFRCAGKHGPVRKEGETYDMNVLALLLLGTLTGNELAVGVFVHPALSRLSDDQHAAGAQSLARLYGKVGPFWYSATLLALLAAAWRADKKGAGKPMLSLSALLLLASLALTILRLVPINSDVADWDLSALPADWKAKRALWDKRHGVRVGILLLSLAALAYGATRR